MSGGEHILGNVSFAPALHLWEEQPSVRELYDQACQSIVRMEIQAEEKDARIAVLEEEQKILQRTIDGLRDQLCADKCRDKAAADGGWGNI